MQYEFRRTPKSGTTGRRRLLLVTFIALCIVLANFASGGMIAAGARDVVAPIWNVGGRIGSSISGSAFFTSRSSLAAQVTALQAEVQQEQLQAAAFQVVQAENASLSQLTHLAQTTPGLAAPITSSFIASPYGTFTIGAGSSDNVAEGALVLAQGNFVIGKVTQVQDHQSLVQQLFAPGVATPVTIDGAAATASGQGGEAVAQVPHGISVNEGDPVLAPGYGNRAIGIVAHVDSNPANAQSAVYISLPVGISSLQYVYVIS